MASLYLLSKVSFLAYSTRLSSLESLDVTISQEINTKSCLAFLFLFSQTFVFENSIINQQTHSVGVIDF